LYLQANINETDKNKNGDSVGIFLGQSRWDGSNNKLMISDVSTRVNFNLSQAGGSAYR
jgi:hypothetical protein